MAIQVSGTTVIDNSRNITNCGTGSFSGTVSVATPTSGSHATTKTYVDAATGAGAIKAWANWEADGTLRASQGLSSLTKVNTARYRLNFSATISNYAFGGGAGYNTGSNGTGMSVICLSQNNGSYSTSYLEVTNNYQNGGIHENPVNSCAVFA